MTQVSEICIIKRGLEESRNVIMYGPQCSGKTTLARELTDFSYVSLGQSVRESDDEKLLQQAESLIQNAMPWPAELGLSFIEQDLRQGFDSKGRILLDGYPRKIDEYKVLTEWIQREDLPLVDAFLEVTAEKEKLLARYALREARNFESQRFFDLRYQLYEEFKTDITSLAIKNLIFDTTDVPNPS